MSETKNNRGWICALVTVAFAALAISGPMMLLHLTIPLDLKLLHVVMGIVFVVAGVAHLALNAKTFTAHFRNRPAIVTTVAAVAIAVALLFIGNPGGAGPHRYGPGQEELDVGPGGDVDNGTGSLDNGPGPFEDGPRGNGRGGRFGNGRWSAFDNESSGGGQ
ncbi:MAG: DUF4405 domain-containing protein [Deltaproteobacteria bacterium]|nr:DUF4405 domain-containing protein [Candidatus Zymogenaceae bacterium]